MENQDSSVSIIVKHCGTEYKIENLLYDHTVAYVKELIEELTNVRTIRQKLFGLKSRDPSKQISDDTTLEELDIKDGMKLMMMGTQEKEINEIENTLTSDAPQLDDDFDFHMDGEVDLDAMIQKDPVNKRKIECRIKHYKINMINQPRPNKKLLVLDIDYTLFDNRTTAQSAVEIMRPYLHEFLTSAYQKYDIVIWSATSMRYIEAKMQELRVVNNPNYKIVFYLDSAAMISIFSSKYGLISIKPLEVIWGKFPDRYNSKNTIMFDDVRRNFLMNPQNGLKIKAYREAPKNRSTDKELLYLGKYLEKISDMEDLSSLNHRNWQKLINAPKRHKE